jgi:hypothetical protein
MKGDRHPITERDGAGLIEQEYVDIARRLDRPAARSQDILPDEPIDSAYPDGAE